MSYISRPALRRIIVIVVAMASSTSAQNIQNPQSAVDNLFRSSLHVDSSTGALQLQIPLGEFRGRGEASLPVTLNYSSKVWNVKYLSTVPCSGEPVSAFIADYAKSSASGWTSTVGWFLPQPDLSLETYDLLTQKPSTQSTNLRRMARRYVTLPDGSRHELRLDDTVHNLTDNLAGRYYAVDGSRLWLDWTDAANNVLFMPNGSRIVTANGSTQYFDRNGNFLTYNSGTWTDTLGRSIGIPIPGSAPAAGDYPYTLPGGMTYALRWRNLADALTNSSQSLRYKGDAPNANCHPGGFQSNNLFSSTDDQQKVQQGSIHNPVVLWQIGLPNNTNYTFTYNVYGELDKIVYPTGGSEQFTYDVLAPLGGQLDDGTYSQANRGVTSRIVNDGITTPQIWQYNSGASYEAGVDPLTAMRSVSQPDGTVTKTWYYKSRGSEIKFGFDDARSGMAREERVYNPSGTMLRRRLMLLAMDGPQAGGYSTASRNARVTKTVEIMLDTGGDALAALTEMTYDADLNVTRTKRYGYVPVPQTTAQTGDFASMPNLNSTLVRTEETDYDFSSNQNYRARNLLSLPTDTRVKDGAGNIVAQSSISYDESSLLTYGMVTNWTDPGTPARGNPTTTSQWLNVNGSTIATFPSGSYLATHAQYDQCGSVRKTWDARDTTLTNPSQVSYLDAFSDGSSHNSYAFPTTITTAVPDSTNTYGSNAAFTTTAVYDFNTGSVKSTTDPNGKTTSYDYTDTLNRLRQVTLPDTGRVRYNYFDAPGDLYVQVLTDEDSRSIETRKYFDGLGRPVRSFLYDGTASTPWVVTDTYYDTSGRVSKVSNPYRVSSPSSIVPPFVNCSACTTTVYDALSRVLNVTTPDNAQVVTSYGAVTSGGPLGITTTLTDQAGRMRRSLTDALGRLVRVDEPNKDTGSLDVGGMSTSYTYDVLGNLRKVAQGGQLRFFLYDSLARLIRVKNPEQEAGSAASNLTDPITSNPQWSMAYSYDSNGNLTSRVDARNITTNYGYDALNRNISVTYSDGNTPAVYRYYDSATNGRGRLYWDQSMGVSANVFDAYDAMGRPTQYHQRFWINGAWGQFFNITRSYDKAGDVLTQTYPSGRAVAYTYDIAGRVDSHSGNIGDGVTRTYASNITYSEFGGMQQEQFGTQTPLFHKLHYNVRGQMYDVRLSTVPWATDHWNCNRGALALYFGYAHQQSGPLNNGNVTMMQHFVPANEQFTAYNYTEQRYAYDKLNRLTSVAEYPGTPASLGAISFTQTFDYDVFGNRTINQAGTTQMNGINRLQTAISAATNRLYAPGETDLSHSLLDYDAAGNQKKDYYSSPGNNFDRTYDAENRMISSTLTYSGGSQLTTYTYDADGSRVKRKLGAVETCQVYGMDGELLGEYASGAAPFVATTEYGYRNGELLVTVSSGDDQRLKRFVQALYYGALQRDPTAQELTDKTNELATAGTQSQAQLLATARQIASSLFISTAYETSPYRSDVQYVADLYYAYLQRGPDDGGLSFWTGQLPGSGRANVCNDFGVSPEFATLVSTLYGTAVSDNERTEHFVNNFYLGAYGRNATATELQQQRDSLNSAAAQGSNQVQAQAETMGRSLFAAQVNDASLSNTQYVTNLYEAFLQRGPDAIGLGFWSGGATLGQGRQNVLNAFATCPPFRELAGTLYREAYWLVTDHLGTPRMVANKSGSLADVKRHDYLPFGEELGSISARSPAMGYNSNDTVRQKFTLKERDNETGLDYFLARFYASSQGRFTGTDPLLGSGRPGMPQSWNRYAYVLNNPLRLVDPDGMKDAPPQQVTRIGQDKVINKGIEEIQKNAKPLDKGVAPVPTQAISIPGEQTVLNNATIIGPDNNTLGTGVNGYMQPVALVVLDQGGNIMKAPDDMFVVENVQGENDAAKQEIKAGGHVTTNGEERGQSSNGAFYDIQVRGLGPKPLDVRTTQDVTVRQYFGPKQTDYKEIFQITGNKIRFNDTKKQITFTPGTVKKL